MNESIPKTKQRSAEIMGITNTYMMTSSEYAVINNNEAILRRRRNFFAEVNKPFGFVKRNLSP